MRRNIKFILVLFLVSLVMIFQSCSCGAEKYELKFETNGGVEIATEMVKSGTNYELPEITRENYNFKGWYLSSDLKGEAVKNITITENTVVYASWAELAKINLDLDGGTLSENYIYAEVGSSVLDYVKDLKPTKSNLVFGGWFAGDAEITQSTKLTSKGITLKAKYQVKYEITILKQKLTKDGYEEVKEEHQDYVGKKITFNENYEGFTEVQKSDSNYEVTLDADSSKNNLKIYFDRNEYTITLRSNYPNKDLKENTKAITLLYGEEVELPTVDFSCEGYYLLGFATTVDGEMVYNAHFIENVLYNQEKGEVETAKLTTSRNISLYAVWNKGYKDMFGGSDYLFLTGDKETIYLCRGGVYFVGEYFESDNGFIFYNDFENIEGIIFEDGTFAYYNEKRDEYSATLYQVGTGLVETEKILFDAYNGITYSKVIEGKTDLSKGSYVIDENNYYIATFTEGTMAGQTIKMVIGSVTINGAKTDAYQVCNQAQADLGILVRFVLNNGQITYYTSAYQIILSGFGTLVMNSGNNKGTSYYYIFDEEKNLVTLTNSSGAQAGVIKIMEFNGTKGYMIYDSSLDHEYVDADGNKLVLDGAINAVYTLKDGTEVSGYYTTQSSAFGGYIVKLITTDNTYTFLTKTTSEVVTTTNDKQEEVKETVYHYGFESKQNGYAEYYYKDQAGTYYAPLIVVNDSEAGTAKVYGYTTSKTFELVLLGTFTYDETTKLYTFETTKYYLAEVMTNPMDISLIDKFVCSLDTTTTSYAISYWYSSTSGDITTNNDVSYTSADGAKLTLISGIAIFAKDGYVITGTYATKNGLTTITYNSSYYVYLEIDEENKTFVTLDYAPYSAYVADENNQVSKKLYLTFDGKGKADYCYYVIENVEGEDQEVLKKINGTITKLDEYTKQGYQVYEFKSDEKTFKYLMITSSSTAYVLPAYGKYQGNYTSVDGILYLDGFSYYASFVDKDAVEYVGMYSAVDDVVMINTTNGYLYFDLKENKSFSVRGTDYGTYILMDNQGAPGLYLEFNGYGKLSVYKMVKNVEDETKYDQVFIDENGTYSNVDGYYLLTYKEDNKDVTINGYLSTYTYNSATYRTFAVEHKEVVQTFINTKDWSILKLDSIGNATKIDNKGNVEKGTFMIITDSLLYYINSDSTDANIYKYNTKKGTITPSEFTARGYYTADLKSLLFSKYGFAIFNNETRYYYAMEGNNVIIYHQDASSEQANQYGFIEENFGEFENVKEYGGLTYYANDGYAINFKRVEATASKYPVLVSSTEERYATLEDLTFTPSGGDVFSVSGSVKIDGKTQSCYVTRKLVEKQYVMYVTIGYYQFDITATFTGKDDQGESNSTYEVTGMRYVRSFYPYTFMNNYYMIYSFYGASVASTYENNLGMVYICQEFDEEGKSIDDYMKVEFYEGQKNVYDLEGGYLGVDHAAYTYENNIYTIEVQGTDGYTYEIHLYFSLHNAFQMYGYRLYALTRKEVITDGDYEVTIERLIATDTTYAPGTIYSVSLKYQGNDVDCAQLYSINGQIQYVVRTYDETTKLITSSTYYRFDFVEKDSQIVGEDESEVVNPYKSVTVTKVDCTTIYDADNKNYVDIVDGKVVLIAMNGSLYTPITSEYDDVNHVYTITFSSGTQYKVTITEGVMSYEKVEVTEGE